jgi:outer membrane protein OmpA-like peptidoglycan-associated protein
MSNFLLDSITDVLRSGSLGTIAGQLGQSEQQVTRGLQMSVASLGAGVAAKTEDRGFIRQLFELATTRGVDPTRAMADPATLLTENAVDSPTATASAQLLSSLFGGNMSEVTSTIAGATGLRPESATSLLGMAVPLVLGVLGSRIRAGGLTAAGFADWLAGQRDSLLSAAPPALRGILSVGAPATQPQQPVTPAVTLGTGPRPGARPDRWLWPTIAAILVLGVLWNVMRGNRVGTYTNKADTAAGDVAQPVSTAPGATATLVSRHLSTGVDLRVPDNGTETRLLAYLQDSSRHGTDTTWFDFDRLLFQTNSATLAPSSDDQLHDVAAILIAYPRAHATIGGYTDNTGDADGNVRLSQDRAASVVSQLVAQGVTSDRLTAKGYGNTHPVADNNTDVGRAQNRRIAIRITEQ